MFEKLKELKFDNELLTDLPLLFTEQKDIMTISSIKFWIDSIEKLVTEFTDGMCYTDEIKVDIDDQNLDASFLKVLSMGYKIPLLEETMNNFNKKNNLDSKVEFKQL